MSQLVDNILALHHDDQRFAKFDVYVCKECGKSQPCPTIRAVDSEQILVRRRDGGGWRSPASEHTYQWDPATGHTYHWISETEAVR